MTDLKPCPFCGGEAELRPTFDIGTNEVDGWFVWCAMGNNCDIKPQTDAYLTEAEAAEAWNTRAERTCELRNMSALEQTLSMVQFRSWCVCSVCGEITPCEVNYCPNCGARVVS